MSKCIASVPLARVEKIAVVFGNGRSMSQVKAAAGCDWIINGGLYDFDTGKPVALLKAGGKVYASENWRAWGYAWDTGPDLSMEVIPADGKANYITCLSLLTPWDGPEAALTYDKVSLGGVRGRSAMALGGGKLTLYCSGDGTADGKTPEALRQELYDMGAETALMLDSGGSSQCDFGGGQSIYSSRRVNNYICVWLKKDSQDDKNKEDKPVSKKVCLDPGHGAETPGKCSPDGTYHEAEFALDLAQRMEKILTRCGVEVTLTRKDEHTLTGGATNAESYARVAVANGISGLDLYVSLHSNAAAGTGWSSARGMLCITSAAGDTAGRNKAAKAILARMKEAGVLVRSEPLTHDSAYIVLRQTAAPAVIVEHGFHTNQEDVALLKDSAYRDKLAEAECKGICDYLGMAWKAAPMEEAPVDTPADWAATSWQKAKSKGVLDGTRPTDGVTRQELAVVLDRAGLL